MKKLKINLEIYSENTIRATLKAYEDYALTTFKFKNEQASIIFWKCKYDEEQTVREFENYMIGIENS